MKPRILDNVWWKLLSLAIATFLWLMFVGAPEFFLGTLPARVRSILGG